MVRCWIHFILQWVHIQDNICSMRYWIKMIFVTKIEQKIYIWKKKSFSKFVTLKYLKIAITHLVFLESPQCIGVHTLALWHFTKRKIVIYNIKKKFATTRTNFNCKNWLH
jgi:hypothetical protein